MNHLSISYRTVALCVLLVAAAANSPSASEPLPVSVVPNPECVVSVSAQSYQALRARVEFEPMEYAEERRILKLAQDGDLRAQAYLVEFHTPLAISIAKRYRFTGVPTRDLIGYGLPGLFHAIHAFKFEFENRFDTFATYKVRSAILNELRRLRLNREAGKKREIPFSVLERFETSGGVRPIDQADPKTAAPLEATFQDLREEKIPALLNTLSDRERQVLSLRFGFGVERALTLEEVAEVMNVTKTRIQQLERAGLDRIRKTVWRAKDEYVDLVAIELDAIEEQELKYEILSGTIPGVFDFRSDDYPAAFRLRSESERESLIEEALREVKGNKQVETLIKYLGLRGFEPMRPVDLARERQSGDEALVLNVVKNARNRLRETLAERSAHYQPLLLQP